ncbi:hypothetical protein HRbin30_01672 [bacterium HR30]|nr:hypothetical protein HRbin30_01672 [bacterium HR30]
MELLHLEPLDVFSIRSARPFDVNGVTHADFVWPPPAWTVVGALRGALSELLGLPAVEYGRVESDHPEYSRVVGFLGRPDGAASFCIGPPLIYDQATKAIRWPVPADVLATPDKRRQLLRLSAMDRPPQTHCNVKETRTKVLIPPATLDSHPEKSSRLASFDQGLLMQWLEGRDTLEIAESNAGSERTDFHTEPRIGIRIDPTTGTVEKGLFFLRNAVQLEVGRALVVPLLDRGTSLPWGHLRGQVARFGADGHLVRFADLTPFSLPKLGVDTPLHRARVLCVGPIHPNDIDRLTASDKPVRVHAVAAGKLVRIGGWKLTAAKRDGSEVQYGPRTLRTYYPAGTVLYVESEGDLRELHGQNLATDPAERASGFGFCLVGRW